MTTETTIFSLNAIDTALAAAAPSLDEDEQRLAAVVLRLLAAGKPVGRPALAADLRAAVGEVHVLDVEIEHLGRPRGGLIEHLPKGPRTRADILTGQ